MTGTHLDVRAGMIQPSSGKFEVMSLEEGTEDGVVGKRNNIIIIGIRKLQRDGLMAV